MSSEVRIAALQVAAQAFQDHYEATLARRKRERNAIVPRVHQLPNETMANVFQWVLTSQGEVPHDPTLLHTLARVCGKWHTLVLSSPRLWSRIASYYPLGMTKAFLRRSGTVPLSIVFRSFNVTEFVEAITSSSFRWKTVKWEGEFNILTTTTLRDLPPSVVGLEVIRLPNCESPRSDKLAIQFQGAAPFRHVTLKGVQVTWNTPRLSCLATLDLTDISLAWHQVRPVITASPDLEILALRNLSTPTKHNRHPPQCTIIDLPKLSRLVVENVDTDFVTSLVKTLHVPNARFLSINRIPGNTLAELSAPLLRAIIRFMVTAPEITVSSRPASQDADEVVVRSVEPHTASRKQDAIGFYMSCQIEPQGDLLDLLTQASVFVASSGSSSPVILEVGSPPVFIKPTAASTNVVIPRAVLLNLSQIKKIKIHDGVDAQALVDTLAATEGGQLCPDLESLYVGNTRIWSLL